MAGTEQAQTIEVRVDQASQLFNTLDPFPFHERDLDHDAEEYIVGWAREIGHRQPLSIVVHLPPGEENSEAARNLQTALGRFFDYRADILARDLHEMFRIGRLALLVGISVLALCIVVSQLLVSWANDFYIGRIVGESAIILGWVANWRPIEIFLYDWWPLRRRRNLYRRLAAAEIIVKADAKKQ